MAAYNASNFLAETLDDLLAQTFRDFELVAVDDGSTDTTLSILESYAARDSRLVIVRNEVNLGLVASLNRGLERCQAPLVARADADDRYPPDRLQLQVDFLTAHPDIGLLSCGVRKIDERGNYILTRYFPSEDGQIRLRELFVNCFSHPGVMFRTELVRSIGGYDPEYESCEDADLWARLRSHTRAANLAVPLVYYRKHNTSIMQTRGQTGSALSLRVRQRLLSEYLGRSVDLEEAAALQTTFWARAEQPATHEQLAVAQRGFLEVLRVAKERETSATVRFFKDEVARALLRQVSFERTRAEQLRILMQAVLWGPGQTLQRSVGSFRRILRARKPR